MRLDAKAFGLATGVTAGMLFVRLVEIAAPRLLPDVPPLAQRA